MDSTRALRSTVVTMAATVLLTGGTGAVAGAEQDPLPAEQVGASPVQEPLQQEAIQQEPIQQELNRQEPIQQEPNRQDAESAPEVAEVPRVSPVAEVQNVRKIRWRPRTPKLRNKNLAFRLVVQRSWSRGQFRCLDNLWTRESNWNHRAMNRSSGAYGIPQALPAWKMRGAGRDWRFNPKTQIRWGLKYIRGRYGSPCGAWAHSRLHGWY
jgi:hypothetical protein